MTHTQLFVNIIQTLCCKEAVTFYCNCFIFCFLLLAPGPGPRSSRCVTHASHARLQSRRVFQRFLAERGQEQMAVI